MKELFIPCGLFFGRKEAGMKEFFREGLCR